MEDRGPSFFNSLAAAVAAFVLGNLVRWLFGERDCAERIGPAGKYQFVALTNV